VIEPLIEAAEEKQDHPTARDDHKKLHPAGRGIDSAITAIVDCAEEFYLEAGELSGALGAKEPPDEEEFKKALEAVTRLPRVVSSTDADWPPIARAILPSNHSLKRASAVWAPVVAWSILKSASENADERLAAFDQLQLRSALTDVFSHLGIEGEDTWRAAARIRILLSGTYQSSGLLNGTSTFSRKFWDEPDVQWLLAVNESEETLYFNKECLEEMFWWLQLPGLIEQLEKGSVSPQVLVAIQREYDVQLARAKEAGYKFKDYLDLFEKESVSDLEPVRSSSAASVRGEVEKAEADGVHESDSVPVDESRTKV
jgi:hypothetical protein